MSIMLNLEYGISNLKYGICNLELIKDVVYPKLSFLPVYNGGFA